jgi:1-deoxy-D-xylulose-5-phosphate synthase
MRFAKPLDEELLHEVFKKHNLVITVEDGCLMGGMGSAILEFMADNNYTAQVKRLGIPDKYVEHGEQEELHAECGYDVNGIIATAVKMVGVKGNTMAG